MKRAVLVTGIVVFMVALAGCSGSPGVGEAEATTSQADTIHKKVIDSQVGVVCYIYEHAGYAGGSIDCMPLDNQSNETINFGDKPTQSNVNGIVRTVYPTETNVCYTYEHAGYAGGSTACLDFSETNLEG